MKYCVIVYINRSSVSFYYQQNGSKALPLDFIEGNQLPLYFYINNGNFSFGSYAKQQFLNGDPNAFGNYFDLIVSPNKTFNFYGGEKQVKYLLYYSIEQALNHFFNTVLYESNPIESYRTDFPLRFIFESDILEKEIRLIEMLFSEAGFQNSETLSLNKFLFDELIENKLLKATDSVIKLQSINGTLSLQYFQKDFSIPVATKNIQGLGSDPRLKIISEFIFNAAVAITRATLNKSDEINNLFPAAKKFLQSGSAQPNGVVKLSDGSSAFVRIKLRDVNERLANLGLEIKLFAEIDDFIAKNTSNHYKVLLVGDDMNSDYFVNNFTNKYSNVVSTKPETIYNSISRIAKHIESNNYKKISDDGNFIISDDLESINQLLFKIEYTMKSKKELESKIDELTNELKELENIKSGLEKKKKNLLADINKLNSEIKTIEETKLETVPKNTASKTTAPKAAEIDDFLGTPIKKVPEKKITVKKVDPKDFNF